MGDEKLIVNCCSWDWSSSSLLTSNEKLVEMVLGPGQHDDKERRRWEVQLWKPVEREAHRKELPVKKRINPGYSFGAECPTGHVQLYFFLSFERNITNFGDGKRADKRVLDVEHSRRPTRSSLVQLIGRDVIAAVTCETSLQKQRSGAVVVVVSRRKVRLVKENKRRERTVQEQLKKILKNHVIYLGPAMESRLEHGHLDRGTYVFRTRIHFGTNVIELY